MPLMISRSGEVADVPAEHVDHYLGLGKGYRLFGPGTAMGLRGEGRENTNPTDELGTGTDPWISPADIVAGALVGPAQAGIRGIGGIASRVASSIRPSSAAARAAAKVAGNAVRAGVEGTPVVGQMAKEMMAAGGRQTVGRGAAQPIGNTLAREVAPQAGSAIEAAAGPSAESRAALTSALEQPAAATLEGNAAMSKALSPADKLRAIKPLAKGASEEAIHAHKVELELAMDEAKLSASARKALRQTFGHEAAAARPSMSVVSRETVPARPSASNAADLPESWKPRPSAAPEPDNPTLLAKPRPEGWDTPFSRHEHGYWSDSKQSQVAIETMSQNHLVNAIEKRTGELAKWGEGAAKRSPVKWSELQALKKELAWRVEHGGVNVQGARAPAGSAD